MYKLNELQRNVLITPDEVIFHAPSSHTLDPRTIKQSIIIAEERFVRQAVGSDYYDQLIADKNRLVTDANRDALQAAIDAYYTNADKKPKQLVNGDIVNASEFLGTDDLALWVTFLWKFTAEVVVLATLPEGYVQLKTEGAVHNQATNSPLAGGGVVTPDLSSMKWALDKKLFDRIDPLWEAMHRWLCAQQAADPDIYPLYDKTCDCNAKGVAYKRKSDIILDIYANRSSDYLTRRDPLRHPACDDDCEDW